MTSYTSLTSRSSWYYRHFYGCSRNVSSGRARCCSRTECWYINTAALDRGGRSPPPPKNIRDSSKNERRYRSETWQTFSYHNLLLLLFLVIDAFYTGKATSNNRSGALLRLSRRTLSNKKLLPKRSITSINQSKSLLLRMSRRAPSTQ